MILEYRDKGYTVPDTKDFQPVKRTGSVTCAVIEVSTLPWKAHHRASHSVWEDEKSTYNKKEDGS